MKEKTGLIASNSSKNHKKIICKTTENTFAAKPVFSFLLLYYVGEGSGDSLSYTKYWNKIIKKISCKTSIESSRIKLKTKLKCVQCTLYIIAVLIKIAKNSGEEGMGPELWTNPHKCRDVRRRGKSKSQIPERLLWKPPHASSLTNFHIFFVTNETSSAAVKKFQKIILFFCQFLFKINHEYFLYYFILQYAKFTWNCTENQ